MKPTHLLVLAVFGFAPAAAAQQQVPAEPAQAPASENQHVVRRGDTLWDLAGRYLSNPYRWPEIFEANRAVINNPHLIYPQAMLLIPGVALPVTAPPGLSPSLGAVIGRGLDSPTVFSAVAAPQTESHITGLRIGRPDEAPVIQSGAFYGAGLLVPDSLMRPLGTLREVISPTALNRRAMPQVQLYSKVLATVGPGVQAGDRLHLMRPDRRVEPYGRIYVSTGTAIVLSVEQGVATVEVDRMYDQVTVGDLALAMPEMPLVSGIAAPPATALEGTLVAFETAQPVPSREDLAFLDVGTLSGVAPGDEFAAYLPPSPADWGVRPAVEVARMQVIRAGTATATVRIVSMQHPALAAGLPVRLVARIR